MKPSDGPARVHDASEEVFDPSEQEDLELVEARATRYTLSSYGADYPVDGLVKRMESEAIFIPPFQRGFVWTTVQASQFIESLLLGLPVPGIFLYKEPESQKLMVVDGQQRLRSLQSFYQGILNGREFKLTGVAREFDGCTYRSLGEADRRRLDDSVVHATVFRQDDPGDDKGSVYEIFERLNTSGTPLNHQEIRACVSRGPMVKLLAELAGYSSWARIYGHRSPRRKDEEMILRFFALYYDGGLYNRPMKSYLDAFLEKNRDLQQHSQGDLEGVFKPAVDLAARALGPDAFRPERNLNVALTETVLIGIAHRLARGPLKAEPAVRPAFESLLAVNKMKDWIRTGTTHVENIRGRLQAARAAFQDLA